MGSRDAAMEPMLPELRPPGVGRVVWAIALAGGRPGVRYGVLLVAVAAGLVGGAALLGHAMNAPGLRAYQRSTACGIGDASPPSCQVFRTGTVLGDWPLPLGVHAVRVSVDGRIAVYYGESEVYQRAALVPGSEALVIDWHGRAARLVGQGLAVEPFEGPPGLAFALIVLAVVCELVCALALVLQGVVWRLRARASPLPGLGRRPAIPPSLQLVFPGALVVAALAGRTGHAAIAVPLHAACGLLVSTLLGTAGLASARSLGPVVRRGLDGLSDDAALRLGADVALASVLTGLCLALTVDLVVADTLTFPW